MTRKDIQILAALVVALVLAVLILNRDDRSENASPGRLLLPGFAQQANDAQRIRVVVAESNPIMIRRDLDHWVVASRDDYPADISKLRQIIVALADAKILEEKTSNPDLYEKLRIGDPEDGGSGTMITIEGDGFTDSVVVGKQVQGDRRYVRVAGTKPGYLIDQQLNIPQDSSGWMLPGIVDIGAKRVRKVTIKHANGEVIVVEKNARNLTDFAVLDIPQGRELKYATLGNSIAAALGKLDLDDVRVAEDATTPTSSAVIQTWDGLQISVAIIADDQASWLAFSAAMTPDSEMPHEPAAETGDSVVSSNADSAAVGNEIADLNKRLGGWQFKIADYKKDLLSKHWEDMLKPLAIDSK